MRDWSVYTHALDRGVRLELTEVGFRVVDASAASLAIDAKIDNGDALTVEELSAVLPRDNVSFYASGVVDMAKLEAACAAFNAVFAS